MTDRVANEIRFGVMISAVALITAGLIGSALVRDPAPVERTASPAARKQIGHIADNPNIQVVTERLRRLSTARDGATIAFNSAGSVTITVTDIPDLGTIKVEHRGTLRDAMDAFVRKMNAARSERMFKP